MNIIEYAQSFIGTPYRWGGNSPVLGYDCSGFICELLRFKGLIKGDYSAQGIFDLFEGKLRSQLTEGSLLFFGQTRRKITHIAMAIDEDLMIEAGGGDSKTHTKEEADRDMAFVRVRPITSRKDLIAVLKLESL